MRRERCATEAAHKDLISRPPLRIRKTLGWGEGVNFLMNFNLRRILDKNNYYGIWAYQLIHEQDPWEADCRSVSQKITKGSFPLTIPCLKHINPAHTQFYAQISEITCISHFRACYMFITSHRPNNIRIHAEGYKPRRFLKQQTDIGTFSCFWIRALPKPQIYNWCYLMTLH